MSLWWKHFFPSNFIHSMVSIHLLRDILKMLIYQTFYFNLRLFLYFSLFCTSMRV
jgi:hypothetical protein